MLGILFLLVALFLMFFPVEGYGALVVLFCACMLTSGILEIVFSVSNRGILPAWGWYLTCGIIDILLGFLLIWYPGITAIIIPYLLSFWTMFRGFTAIGFSFDFNRLGVPGWGWYLVFGILAILCSFAIIWNPDIGAFASVYILAFAFLFIGFFRIMISIDLRNLSRKYNE